MVITNVPEPCGHVGPYMTIGRRSRQRPKCNLTRGHRGNHELVSHYSFNTIARWTRTGTALAKPGGTRPSLAKGR